MPRTGTTRTFTISFPAPLAEQVEQLAAKESRTTSELFREAFRVYRAEQLRAVLDESNAEAGRGFPGETHSNAAHVDKNDRALLETQGPASPAPGKAGDASDTGTPSDRGTHRATKGVPTFMPSL